MEPGIGVIIVTHNSAHVVGDLLDSLPDALDGLAASIVVVDNGSSDHTVALVQQRGDCHLVQAENLGYAAGINTGVRYLEHCGRLLVLNPDLRLLPRSVRPMVDSLSRRSIGIVCPRVLNGDGSLQYSLRREPTLLRAVGLGFTGYPAFSEHIVDSKRYEAPSVVDWALGAILMISRACHEDLGGWDESFFLFSEETDFCIRARDEGWLTLYEPRAVAIHIGGQSGQNGRIHSMQILNRVRFFARRHGVIAANLYLWLTVASELSWALRGQSLSRHSLRALLVPAHRPPELRCSNNLVPR
jgi:GT2 family glycosyltransferase